MNHTHFCRFRRLISGAGCLLALVSLTACDSPQPGDAAVKAHSAQPTKGLARLSPKN